jgi:c-di-GMP-related signal transduction protein
MLGLSFPAGPEIEKLNPQNSGRNRINVYRDMYSIFYNHLVDDNKPATMEAWARTVPYFDIMHLYFAYYKSTFEGSNFVPYNCPHCKNIFLEKKDIQDMVKYINEEAKTKLKAIFNKDTTSLNEYQARLVQISDSYAISFKLPSVYNVIFENSVLDEAFTRKYSDILGLISYIDEIYYIDQESNQLIPIDTKPVPDNLAKTVRRKIRIYHDILQQLDSDDYANILTEMNDINKEYNKDDITYIIPATKCQKCGKDIKEEAKNPLDMLLHGISW